MALSEAALPDQLVAIIAEQDAPLAVNADAAASYQTFNRVLATIKRAGVTRLGFVGNERFADAF